MRNRVSSAVDIGVAKHELSSGGSILIDRVTDRIIRGQTPDCLPQRAVGPSRSRSLCGGIAQWCRCPKGAPKRAGESPIKRVPDRRLGGGYRPPGACRPLTATDRHFEVMPHLDMTASKWDTSMGTLKSKVADVRRYVRSNLAAIGVMTSASGWRFKGPAARDCYPSRIGPIWAPYGSDKVASAGRLHSAPSGPRSGDSGGSLRRHPHGLGG
jgi:hypothetical protein